MRWGSYPILALAALLLLISWLVRKTR